MRRIALLAAMTSLAGCTRYEGPLEVRKKDRADAAGYTIPEQQRRARERNSFIQDNPNLYPGAQVDGPSPIGR